MSEASPQLPEEDGRTVRYQPLVIVLVAVCAGIVADRAWGLSVEVSWTVAGVAWGLWMILWRRGWDRLGSVALLVSVAACGAAWHHMRWHRFADDDLGCYARMVGRPVCTEAVAIKGPRRLPAPEFDPMQIIPGGDRTRVEMKVVGVRDGAGWRPASGLTRLTVDGHLLGVHAGDRLRIFGEMSSPRPAMNPGDFDLARHHRADRRLSQLTADYPDCVTVVEHGQPVRPARWIEKLRREGAKLLWRYVDERRAALAAAVLLGAREEMGPERAKAFMETGTVHLLAISGLHVGIVAGALFLGLRLLAVPRARAAVMVAVVAIVYALLTDARPPAIRAAILVLVLCASAYLGRQRLPFNSLAAAGLVVLILNPADLFRTEVHLSFLAVASLMWFTPQWFGATSRRDRLSRLSEEERGRLSRLLWGVLGWVWRLALASTAIWLLTLPLVMARFHLLVPIAPVLNTVLWLPMGFALVSGFGVLAFGWLLPPLGAAFGWCCDSSLWVLESCIEFARDVPGSHFWVPGPADWWLVGFYGGLGVLAAFPGIRPPRRWCWALLAGWVAVGFIPSALRRNEGRLDCTFLSVGHGCAVVVELPSGQTLLYDAGQLGSPQIGARSVASCLWSRGITHLDAVVLSHPDADHYNMLPELLEWFSVGVVYIPPGMFARENRAIVALQEAIEDAGVCTGQIRVGDRLRAGDDCLIEVLHPPRGGIPGSDNANSVVLALQYLGHRVLLTGDLEPPGLHDVLAEEPWDCDVLLAPHHGSRRSDPPGLAAWCKPEWVAISGSLSSLQTETTASYRAAGARVLHTGEVGAVRAVIDARGITVWGLLMRQD